MMIPKRVQNDHTGHCDNCGHELGGWKWIFGESTGCRKNCAIADYHRDSRYEDQDGEEISELDGPTCSMSGSERGSPESNLRVSIFVRELLPWLRF